MNKEEMSKVVDAALRSYSWDIYRTTSLPEYIAHLIVDAQSKEGRQPSPLRVEIKAALP